MLFFAVALWWVWRSQRIHRERLERRSVALKAQDQRADGSAHLARDSHPSASSHPSKSASVDATTDPRAESIRWYGDGEHLTVAGFVLNSPRVYASPGRKGLQWASDPSEIIGSAPVRRPTGEVAPMGYWPWYSRIEPEWRYAYLEWLASGKRALPHTEGLLFLYYYGIERRLLIDGLNRGEMLREILRLRKLDEPRVGTKEGRSFRGYSAGLLWFELARSPELFDNRAFSTVCQMTEHWSDATLPVPLAWLTRAGKPLNAELAMHMARLNPRSQRSVVVRRVGDEFKGLFGKRYAEQYGDGLAMKVSKRSHRYTYRPASGGLGEVSCSITGPIGMPSQFEPLADIWNSCVADLRRLSKVAIPGAEKMTAEVWDALPTELKADVEHPLATAFQAIVHAHYPQITEGGAQCHEALVPIGTLATPLRIEARPRLTGVQSRRIVESVEQSGFALEPDVRLTGRTYAWDEAVAVFPLVDDSPVEGGRYLAASYMLKLGLFVAESDGHIDEEELRSLSEQIEGVFGLPPHEQRRLEALRAVLIRAGVTLTPITKQLEATLAPDTRAAVGRLLVAIAAASAGIDNKELTALRKCYRALSLPPELLDATIAEVAPRSDSGLVTVQPATPSVPGEPIPRVGLRLDRQAISAIMAETRDVARLLADAMTDEADELAPPESPTSTPQALATALTTTVGTTVAAPGGTPSLPPRFAGFLSDLRSRPSWPRAEAESLARKHGLMLSGAIEGINEWAFDSHGGPLIEENGDSLEVNASIQ